MNPGQAVQLIHDIHTALVCIPASTPGIVEWCDGRICRVQFVGFIVQSNIPAAWLRPVTLVVAEAVSA